MYDSIYDDYTTYQYYNGDLSLIEHPLDMYPWISCSSLSTFVSTEKIVAKCDYYIKDGTNYSCSSCKFGFVGAVDNTT